MENDHAPNPGLPTNTPTSPSEIQRATSQSQDRDVAEKTSHLQAGAGASPAGDAQPATPNPLDDPDDAKDQTEGSQRQLRQEPASRRLAQEELRRTEVRLQQALDAASMGTFIWHVHEGRDEPDARMLKLLGLPLDGSPFLRGALATVMHPEDRERYAASVARACDPTQGDRFFREDIRVTTMGGSTRWLVVSGQACFEGEPRRATHVVGAAVDITARKLHEDRLRAREEHLDSLANSMPQIVWGNDASGLANYFNQRWFEYSGLTFAESVGLGWEAIVHPQDAPLSQAAWRRAKEAGELFEYETRLRRADGAYRWFISRNVPIRDLTGQLVGWSGTSTDIHDLKVAQLGMQESEARALALISNLPGGAAFILDQDLRYVLAEGEALTLAEVGPSNFVGRTIYEALPPSLAERYAPRYRQALAGEPFTDEHAVNDRHYLTRGVPLRAADGTVSQVLAVSYDITERKRVENNLEVSEERFRVALEAAEMAAWDYDIPRRRGVWNPQHYRLLGLAPAQDEVTPADFIRSVHPDDVAHVTECLRKAVEETGIYETDFRIIRADNSEVRWMSGFGRAIKWSDGYAARMTGVMFDITERRASEDRLAATQERLRLLVESALEHAIISLDHDRRVTSWNSGAEKILGYTREEIFGHSADIIFTPEDLAAGIPDKEQRAALAHGYADDNRWTQRKDGSRFWANGAMLPMRARSDGEVIGFVKILRDETENHQAKEALEKSRADLWTALQETERARAEVEAAGKAKDQFLAVLSHELRTPLTPVLVTTHALTRLTNLPPKVREALAIIERNVRTEARFIDDLLDLTRIGRGKLEIERVPVDLHEAIRRAVEVCEGTIAVKNQQLEVLLEAPEHAMKGDLARLQQLFWNLLNNASKFTPAGSLIRITSRASAKVGHVEVEVMDSGIGIEADAVDRIFAPFEQADAMVAKTYGGLGLGLAISRAVAEVHGGTLEVFSAGLGKGATFRVYLPLDTFSPQDSEVPLPHIPG